VIIDDTVKGSPVTGAACLLAALLCVAGAGPAQAECSDAPRPEVQWVRCDMTGRDMSGANLSGGDLRQTRFNRGIMENSILRDADGRRAQFVSVNLRNADLTGARLNSADFTRADMRDASLRDADLTEARLFRADLRGADLSGARLSDADLFRADLTGALWTDGETVCRDNSIGSCR